MNRIYVHIKYLFLILKYSLMKTLSYRVDFILGFLGTALWNLGALLFLKFTLGNINEIAGWDFYDLVLLHATGQVWAYLYFTFSYPSLSHFGEYINAGGLDYLLTKPLNSLITSTLQSFDYVAIFSMLQPFAMMFYSFSNKSYSISLGSVLLYLFTIVISTIITHLLEVTLSSTTFWFPKTELGGFYFGTSDVSHYPYEIFSGKVLRLIFFTIVPYALIVNVPFRVLINKLDYRLLILQFFVLIFFVIISKLIWKAGLKKYQGASS